MGARQTDANAGQVEYWNSAVGKKWADYQEPLDRLLSDVRDELIRRAAPQPGERALDVGCGTGDTTLALAERVLPGGEVTGSDISEPLLAIARRRVEGRAEIRLLKSDAQTHRFGEGRFDVIASRYGVMFFDDPVSAFANLARALRPGGRMAFAAWDSVPNNLWMSASKAAAVARLGSVPADPPETPGPFAFANTSRVLKILAEAGLAEPEVATPDLHLLVDGTPEDAAVLASAIGPVPRIMNDYGGTDEDLAAIRAATADAFRPYAAGGIVRVPARVHFFSARRP
ncbi:MAG: class I SAM-dependent methyltransferase [Paracoccaceae bacterium]